jgi:two-component system, cell cycle sensor histidine kinase and response regulator CckA
MGSIAPIGPFVNRKAATMEPLPIRRIGVRCPRVASPSVGIQEQKLPIAIFTGRGDSVAVVLIVEDEDQVRVLAESILREHGHDTLSAANVEQALALLATEQPVDLLFTDIGLHDERQGGLLLAQKAVELRPDLAVLYTTGQGVTDGMRALFVMRYGFVPKPYTVDQLADALDSLGFSND